MLQKLAIAALPLMLSAAAIVAPPNPVRSHDRSTVVATTTSGRHDLGTQATDNAADRQAKPIRFVVASVGNEARYRVREQLARVDFPSDAIGKTNQVTGALVIGADGKIARDGSSFTVDLKSIQSDNMRRDGFVRRNTLQTDSFPTAVFIPASATGLPATLPVTGEMTFQLMGDLTIHGVTRPATWQVKASRNASGSVTGTATTNFRFADFGMTIPRVGMVLSVDDSITLEYDFNLIPQAPTL